MALLGELLVQERSPRHAAAIVRSLAEAGSIRGDQVLGLSAHAVRLIGDRTSERIRGFQGRGVSEEERLVWLTAGQAVQRVIAQTTGATPASAGRSAWAGTSPRRSISTSRAGAWSRSRSGMTTTRP